MVHNVAAAAARTSVGTEEGEGDAMYRVLEHCH